MSDILNHRLISERYFFPRKGGFNDPFWVDCGDARLACSYHQIDPAAKTLIHFHGNGEIVDDWQGDFVEIILQMGCNVFLAELRGYGQSTGTPQLEKMLSDVVPTVEALQRPVSDLIFFGRSVGSLFAIEAAARFPEAAGLIIESGVADVKERLYDWAGGGVKTLKIFPHGNHNDIMVVNAREYFSLLAEFIGSL